MSGDYPGEPSIFTRVLIRGRQVGHKHPQKVMMEVQGHGEGEMLHSWLWRWRMGPQAKAGKANGRLAGAVTRRSGRPTGWGNWAGWEAPGGLPRREGTSPQYPVPQHPLWATPRFRPS